MNTRKLIGIMAEQEVTQAQLANRIGISLSALNRKLKTGKFTVGEIEKIRSALGIGKKEMASIVCTEFPPKSTEKSGTIRHTVAQVATAESVEK